ncbi:MAG: dipeptidase [Chloroflexota bacterium]
MNKAKIIVFDGHNDTLLNLYDNERGKGRSFFEQSETGHIDLPRALAGGLGAGFFAVFIKSPPSQRTMTPDSYPGSTGQAGYELPKPPPVDPLYAIQTAMGMVSLLFQLEAESDGKFAVARSATDIQEAINTGSVAAVLHFEGAEMIDRELAALDVFYQAGLRSLGPVWSRDNIFGTGVPFKFPTSPDIGPGLTADGKRLLKRCNELGILFDLSHLNEKGFWDVERLSDAPLVATHSNAHALCPSARNLTDKQLDAIKGSNGVVGLNYHIAFLREDGRLVKDTSLSEIVKHARYMADRIGVEHIALGSDFDGATMPADLKDAAGLPKLIDALLADGFSEEEVTLIAHGNWLRVLEATWKAS